MCLGARLVALNGTRVSDRVQAVGAHPSVLAFTCEWGRLAHFFCHFSGTAKWQVPTRTAAHRRAMRELAFK